MISNCAAACNSPHSETVTTRSSSGLNPGYNSCPLLVLGVKVPVSTQGVQLQSQATSITDEKPCWNLTTRIAFRFCFVYFGLFCLLTQVLGGLIPLPSVDLPDPSTLWPFRQMVFWTATHVFHVSQPLVYQASGSGDKTYDWVLQFCIVITALVATAIWSVLDRERENYSTMYKWFRLFMRFFLAGQMLGYGWAKAVPLQMPFPRLYTLMEPFGNMSPMGVLWASIGASPAYEIFAGCAEMLGGILLFLPCTAMLGALICLADMTQVFMLNMTYDVPVKLFSFHLILLSLFLLAPDIKRLVDLFFRNRPVQPSAQFPLFATPRANRVALVVQIVFGVFLMGMNAYGSRTLWYQFGGGSPKSTLYGIWNVEQLTVDGQPRPPLMSDHERWRRVIFDVPTRAAFQKMDESLARYGAAIDTKDNTLKLTKNDDPNWKASFAYTRSAPDRLLLDGEIDGHKERMELQLVDRSKFLLVSRGFHWIQEYPFNR